MYPSTHDNLSKPSANTIRAASVGISPAETVSNLIRSIQYLEYRLGLAPAAVAFTANAATDTLTSAAHGLAANDIVRITSTGTFPGGLTSDTPYYVISVTTNTFQLATTRAGSAIDITSAGSGTHSFTLLFSENKVLTSISGSRSQWSNAQDFTSGSLILPQSATASPTAEGSIAWDTNDDLLKIGTGLGTKTFMDLDSTQTATGKTFTSPTLTTPTIASFVNATHNHQNSAGGGQLVAAALATGAVTPEKLLAGAGTSWSLTSWTPTIGGSGGSPTVGNGTATGKWTQIGKIGIFEAKIVAGTTTVFGSVSTVVSLPFTLDTAILDGRHLIGDFEFLDVSAPAAYWGKLAVASSTGADLYMINTGGSYAQPSNVTTAVPAAVGTGDVLRITGWGVVA